MKYQRLGDLLVSAGALREEDLNRALEIQKESKKRLGDVLIDSGIITEKELIEALELQLGVEFADLSKMAIPSDVTKGIPKAVAVKYELVPVRIQGNDLYIAMRDPLNFPAMEDIKRMTGKHVIPMISTSAGIERTIATLYGNEGAARAIEELKKSANEESEATDSKQDLSDTSENSAPTIRLVNSIIERAITEQASDIHLEARETNMVVRMRVDGILRNVLTVPKNLEAGVVARLKVMCEMDTSERKIPQDGRVKVKRHKQDFDLRVSTLPTIYGEKIVIRVLDKTGKILTREGIGLDKHNEKLFNKLLLNQSGVILIAGPTGSGKSTTMSTMVRELNTENVNIVTLEDPVEYNTEGVNQVQINEATGMTFANGLRAILRQDPDVISVGEIRDGETAEIAMRAAITGHLVLSTIHTSDAASTIDRLFDIGAPSYLTAAALKGVVAQRLVRKICPNCREEYEPDDEELELLGMKRVPDMKFSRGKGCPMCFHTGYKGRTSVFEILLVDGKMRKDINARADHDAIVRDAKANDFKSIADRCRELVLNGTTSASDAIKTIYSTVE